jgi:hypothetical protein
MYMRLSADADAVSVLTTGSVLGRSFDIVTQNFWRLILLTLLTWTPNLLTQPATRYGLVLFHNITSSGRTWMQVAGFVLAFVAAVTFANLTKAVIFYAALGTIKEQPVGFAGALRSGALSFAKFWIISLVLELITALGLIALVIPAVIFRVMSFVAPAAYLLEKLSIAASIKRSRSLTEGFRWHIFVILWVVGIGTIAIALLQHLVLGAPTPGPATLASLALGSVTFVVSALLAAFQTILMVVIYNDLRQEKDGLDLDSVVTVFD